jgi:hypothetical protein
MEIGINLIRFGLDRRGGQDPCAILGTLWLNPCSAGKKNSSVVS